MIINDSILVVTDDGGDIWEVVLTCKFILLLNDIVRYGALSVSLERAFPSSHLPYAKLPITIIP